MIERNISIINNPISGKVYNLSSVSNALSGSTTYTGVFSPVIQTDAAVNIAGFLTSANNGSFVVISCTGTTLVVNNASGVAETHVATATIQMPYSATGSLLVRGEGLGTYTLQGGTFPVLANISANPDSWQLTLNEEGNSTDSVVFNIFTDPDGNHGFQLASVYDGTGDNPSFFEMAWEGGGPFIVLNLPDEITGLWVSSNAQTIGSGYKSTVSLVVAQEGGSNYTLSNDSIAGLTYNGPVVFSSSFQSGGLSINAATPTGIVGQISFGNTTAISATAGSNGDVPAQVLGYLVVDLSGTKVKIPYYAA